MELATSIKESLQRTKAKEVDPTVPDHIDSILNYLQSLSFPNTEINLPTAPEWMQQYVKDRGLVPVQKLPNPQPYTPSQYSDPVLQRLYDGYFLGRH